MEKIIPIHDFYEEDLRNVPIRHIPLLARDDYEEASPHRHNYFEIFFFTQGGGSHLIDFRDFKVQDFSVHFIHPRQVHLLRRDPASHGCVVHFTENMYHEIEALKTVVNHSVATLGVSEVQYGELWLLLTQLAYEYNREVINPAILKGCLQLLVLRCLEFYNKSPLKNSSVPPDDFVRFRELVEDEFCRQKSPGWFATRLELEERHLNTLCRSIVGVTPGEYIRNRILLEAKRLLYNSSLNIKEISYHLGFEDPSYFNRFFKKNLGITAGEFRQKALSL